MRWYVLSFFYIHTIFGWKFVTDNDWAIALNKTDQLLETVEAKYLRRCKNVLTGSKDIGFSQSWQDWFLYRNIFAGKIDGMYLDIGANDPITISNTAFFDKCLGWKGICFEASSKYHKAISEKRSCILVDSCVLDSPRNISFHGKGTDLSIINHDSSLTTQQPSPVTLKCLGILDEIERLGLKGKTIDFLTIDIEGAEPEVFTCFPFDQIDVHVILIETNKLMNYRVVESFFHANGYANAATLMNTGDWLDNLFVKLPHKFVYPPGKPECSRADRVQNEWCAPFSPWPKIHPKNTHHRWDSRFCRALMPNEVVYRSTPATRNKQFKSTSSEKW